MRYFKYGILCVALLFSACTEHRDYTPPQMQVPHAFKGDGWKRAEPKEMTLKNDWWREYDDAFLDTLMRRVATSNQTLLKYEAAYKQALGVLTSEKANLSPTISLTPSVSKNRSSANVGSNATNKITNDLKLPLQVSWMPDFWGTVHRSIEANKAAAQASKGDLQAAKLSIQALLAQSYFQLRGLDFQSILLEKIISSYKKTLTIVQNKYKAGIVTKRDVITALAQVKSFEAQKIDIGVTRAKLEHSIAVLIGQSPSEFSIQPMPLIAKFPKIPVSVPSVLLERRSDIAAAERRVREANIQVGIAQDAWFPSVSLSASSGFESSKLANLVSQPSFIWALGGTLSQALFDGGLRKGNVQQAIALYEQNIANYKQIVLSAFAEVEDGLSTMAILQKEARVQDETVQLANQALDLTLKQYKAGIIDYSSVVSAQSTALSEQSTSVGILSRRMQASVALITALGGGWSDKDLQ